jgi:hypothetical protein
VVIPSLAWVAEFHASFNRAAEITSHYTVEDTVNPLVKKVIFHLSEPMEGKSYMPFQALAHGFAKANNCVLERIYHQPDKLILVIGLKRRLGPVQKKNPLLAGDKAKPFKRS